MLYRIK
jgi:hypothetical protein